MYKQFDKGFDRERASLFNIMGISYSRKEDLDKAIENYQKVVSICKNNNIHHGYLVALNSIGLIYRKQKNMIKLLSIVF